MKKVFLLFLGGWLYKGQVHAQADSISFERLYARKMPAWFNEAKFGVFIVWGVYSVPAWAPKGDYAEWYGYQITEKGSRTFQYHKRVWGEDFAYDKFVPLLTGEGFDAAAWTDLIKRAGARYVVTVANYHDGFAMYPTKYAVSKFGGKWNAFERGPHQDVIGELQKEGNARGLKMGIYYSLYEWWHPLYMSGQLERYIREHLLPKFKEVVTKYRPPVIFLDGEWEHSYQTWHSDELASWLYNESAVKDEVVVNDRWGQTRSRFGDYYSSEYGGGDYPPTHPWQEDRGIGKSYGYNRNEDAWDYNSKAELLRLLATVCSNGGNLLLDIGPAADGRIPAILQERLLQIGDWLRKNGTSIYGTSASPFWPRKFEWGVVTCKGRTLFLHVFDQTLSSLELDGFYSDVKSVSYLADGQAVHFSKDGDKLYLHLDCPRPDPDVSVIAVELAGEANVDKRPHQYESGKIVIPAWSFDIMGKQARMIFDGYEKIAHVSNWMDPGDSIGCSFVNHRRGEYDLSIKYCSDSIAAGSRVLIRLGRQELTFTSANTGGFSGSNYEVHDCGRITLGNTGAQQLTITPLVAGWKNMAIKEIILSPVQGTGREDLHAK